MVYCPSAKLTTRTNQTPAAPPVPSAMIQIRLWTTYQVAEAVKNTWLCGQVKKLDCVGEHISSTLANIHCFTPVWTKVTKTVAINCAIETSQPQRAECRSPNTQSHPLTQKRRTRRNLDVVPQLEVLQKRQCLRNRLH